MTPGYQAESQNGYQQITDVSSAIGLTVPAGTAFALITPETQAVRWRMDGVDPTSTVGYPLPNGGELQLTAAQLTAIKFIEQAASAKLNVYYFK
jgi:hypothetical protein